MLRPHVHATLVPDAAIPRGSHSATSRKRGREIGEAHAQGRILHAQRREVESRNGAYIAYTCFALPAHTGREIDLLEERQLLDEGLRFGVGFGPFAAAVAPWGWIFRRARVGGAIVGAGGIRGSLAREK